MSDWINHPVKLVGEKVLLLALEEKYFEELISSSQDALIWKYMPIDGTNKEKMRDMLKDAVRYRDNNTQYPFVVLDKLSGKVIGSTRFLELNHERKTLEIGYTWYHPEYWGNGYNLECKLLQLTYCFEVLKTIRVQFIASAKNERSRNAIGKIGGKFEGIRRSVGIKNGEKINIAYYSIIEEEWDDVKILLKNLILEKISI